MELSKAQRLFLSESDIEMIELAASDPDQLELSKDAPVPPHALDWSPKSNWVEKAGGLPKFIEDMAVHIMTNSGLPRDHAIAAAVQRTKVLASKGNRRAVEALAQWEKMKAETKAKSAAKG